MLIDAQEWLIDHICALGMSIVGRCGVSLESLNDTCILSAADSDHLPLECSLQRYVNAVSVDRKAPRLHKIVVRIIPCQGLRFSGERLDLTH